jgi:hypothetical protein
VTIMSFPTEEVFQTSRSCPQHSNGQRYRPA